MSKRAKSQRETPRTACTGWPIPPRPPVDATRLRYRPPILKRAR